MGDISVSKIMEFAKQRQQEARKAETLEGKQKEFFCVHDVLASINNFDPMKMRYTNTCIHKAVANGGLVRCSMKSSCKYLTRQHYFYTYNDKPEHHPGIIKEEQPMERITVQPLAQDKLPTQALIPVDAIGNKRIDINITKEGIHITIG